MDPESLAIIFGEYFFKRWNDPSFLLRHNLYSWVEIKDSHNEGLDDLDFKLGNSKL